MNNPQRLIHNNHLILLAVTGILSIVLLILNTPTFIRNIKRNIRVKKLIKANSTINATIQEVYINNKGKKNGEYFPYRLRCKYTNPSTNANYVYDSEDCYINLTQVISTYNAQTVRVYIDQTIPSNYYVDLDSLIPNINIVDPRKLMNEEAERIKAEKKAAEEAAAAAKAAEEAAPVEKAQPGLNNPTTPTNEQPK